MQYLENVNCCRCSIQVMHPKFVFGVETLRNGFATLALCSNECGELIAIDIGLRNAAPGAMPKAMSYVRLTRMEAWEAPTPIAIGVKSLKKALARLEF